MISLLRTIAALTCALAMSTVADRLVAQPADSAALQLEGKIPLGDVRGRIDHMAVDLVRQHLFVAELENNTIGIVDLTNRKVIRTIQGLKEPQGVAFVPSMGALYVANAGDGTVRIFLGPEYAAMGQIDLGDDADTTAAVCGQVAGAHYGESGIPAEWLNRLAMCNEIRGLADRLWQKVNGG